MILAKSHQKNSTFNLKKSHFILNTSYRLIRIDLGSLVLRKVNFTELSSISSHTQPIDSAKPTISLTRTAMLLLD